MSEEITAGAAPAIGNWRKASLSFSNGACVEAGDGPGVVAVRDSWLGDASPVLEVPVAAWRGFTRRLRAQGGAR